MMNWRGGLLLDQILTEYFKEILEEWKIVKFVIRS